MCKFVATNQVEVSRVIDIESFDDVRSAINQLENASKFGEPGDYVSLKIVNGSRMITMRHKIRETQSLVATSFDSDSKPDDAVLN